MRELTTAKIGTLIRISGQIVRTHPVHPELVFGTFVCLDCQTVIKNVEQQFKVCGILIFQVFIIILKKEGVKHEKAKVNSGTSIV